MDTIDSLFSEWKCLQPLKAEDQSRLDRKFMLEFNYNSNHIEGNTLTYGQTEFLLLFGRVVENANMRDLEEMKASNVCLQMVKEEAREPEHHLTEYFIRNLHKTLLREDYSVSTKTVSGEIKTYTIHVGRYKTRPNSVVTKTRERFEYVSPEETPALMSDLLQWYNNAENDGELTPIELATLFHYRYIRIHPFEDGNGRISRLIVNYILAKHGYPMIVVKSEDKDNYLQALNMCDLLTGLDPVDGAHASIGQVAPLGLYLTQCLKRALEVSIKAAKGESIEEPDDFAKRLSLIENSIRKENANHKNSISDKIDVFNFFHRPLVSKLIEELKPAKRFFNNYTEGYYYSKKKEGISLGGFMQLNEGHSLSKELSAEDMSIIQDARSILFYITLDSVKIEYNMRDVRIHLEANVQFDLQSYSFDGKEYPYGTYPDFKTINNFIGKEKLKVLNAIQEASEIKPNY